MSDESKSFLKYWLGMACTAFLGVFMLLFVFLQIYPLLEYLYPLDPTPFIEDPSLLMLLFVNLNLMFIALILLFVALIIAVLFFKKFFKQRKTHLT